MSFLCRRAKVRYFFFLLFPLWRRLRTIDLSSVRFCHSGSNLWEEKIDRDRERERPIELIASEESLSMKVTVTLRNLLFPSFNFRHFLFILLATRRLENLLWRKDEKSLEYLFLRQSPWLVRRKGEGNLCSMSFTFASLKLFHTSFSQIIIEGIVSLSLEYRKRKSLDINSFLQERSNWILNRAVIYTFYLLHDHPTFLSLLFTVDSPVIRIPLRSTRIPVTFQFQWIYLRK